MKNAKWRARIWRRRSAITAVTSTGLLVLVAALFAGGVPGGRPSNSHLRLESEGTRAAFPGAGVTPEPGATPDVTEPFWYVPYENAERMKPKVRGDLNGITVGVEEGPVPACEVGQTLSGNEATETAKGTYFELDLSDLPSGLTPIAETAVLGRCADGTPTWFEIELDPRPLDSDSSNIIITRMRDITWWRDEGSGERWSTGAVASRPAVFLNQIGGLFGNSSVIVLDPEIYGSTRISGSTSPLALLRAVAEAIYR